ncbi:MULTISPECIES: DUF4145 domain-containing protein [unclassified Streptomyces]|uniref:DUF4145 domain-containing protein n=1 Tax=unclassified Streptomyces TaxID=2593676 RepID=UPI000938FED1|nr:DUF4145 domain-containing protein [Streptomyces sp. TSRI0281]OKI34774.1 hypothetical protein A6A29_15040 [Streptomyces sp. TSRI0281]
MTVNEGESLRLYKKALRYAESDPEVFLSTARRAAESILLDIALQEAVGSKPTLESLLTVLTAKGVVPQKMVLAIRTIQNYGNYGSHALETSGEEISAEDVQPCLNALTQLVVWYGRTLSSFAEDEGREALAAVQPTAGTTRLADSTLIVVKALLLGCGFEELMARHHHRVVSVQLPWSDQLVRDIAQGRLDLAVYNEQRLLSMIEDDTELGSQVVSVGRLGHSMGGRNFYLLAARGGRWGGATAEEFLANPAGAQIAVPRHSDMFANVLSAFSTDEDGLRDMGVRVLDVPHHLGLELFHLNRDVLAVGGQNLRMHARDEEDYFELLHSDVLPVATQLRLRSAAANVLVANRAWLAALGTRPSELFRELMRRFHEMGADQCLFETLVDDLVAHAAFPHQSSQARRERLVRHVLFESYRLGDP